MKKFLLFTAACGVSLFAANQASAQEAIMVTEETVVAQEIPCSTKYSVNKNQGWFINLGGGITVPFVENSMPKGDANRQITAAYNFGFGKWFSPYIGWRLDFTGGAMHWENGAFSKAKYVNGNLDFMWDMCNSLGGVNAKRPISIVPFVGLGGTFGWDFKAPASNVVADNGRIKRNVWTLPVSAGIQLRFRLCKYVDFFAEGRASFYGDNFNNCAYGKPVDVNITAIGGLSFNLGGREYGSYNPCDYLAYINNLNNQVNDLRCALANTTAALAAAEAQLPCPQISESVTVVESAPLMATVRFTINSAKISKEEQVNVYNIAQWMNDNPDQNVAILGYADKETGSSSYNMALSQRRAQAVMDMLVNTYGINPDRLSIQAQGSDVQPYDVNNWNRIVIFSIAE